MSGPHALKEWHAVDELMFQRTQDMQPDQNDKRRGKKFMTFLRKVGKRRVFADGHINSE
jgi:hypothetical protein